VDDLAGLGFDDERAIINDDKAIGYVLSLYRVELDCFRQYGADGDFDLGYFNRVNRMGGHILTDDGFLGGFDDHCLSMKRTGAKYDCSCKR